MHTSEAHTEPRRGAARRLALALGLFAVGGAVLVAKTSQPPTGAKKADQKEVEVARPPAPALLPFQGRLLTAKGEPVAAGKVPVIFALYEAPTGGTALWTAKAVVDVEEGGFVHTVLGGDKSLEGMYFGRALYLGVKVGDPRAVAVPANATEMLPRIQVLPVPHARTASIADKARDAHLVQGVNLFKTGAGNPGLVIPAAHLDPRARVPVGTTTFYCGRIDAGHPVPEGWLLCDGGVIDGRDPAFAALADALGDGWGDAGDEVAQTVNLPDFRTRPFGAAPANAPAVSDGPAERSPSNRAQQGHWLIKY